MVNNAFMMYDIKCAGCGCVLHAKVKCMNLTNRNFIKEIPYEFSLCRKV